MLVREKVNSIQIIFLAILAANGAELDAETKAGYTPLHVACHFGSVSMVRFLLERDVKVDVQVSWSVSVKLKLF